MKFIAMHKIISCFLLFFLLACLPSIGQQKPAAKEQQPQIKEYWFVLLLKGNNRDHDSITAAKIQDGHMANMKRLYNEGKLKVAGPFGDDGDWRGIFIFDCKTREEVEQLLKTDPAIAAGRLSYEIHSWWTSPAGSFKPGKPDNSNTNN